ncbi:hypothetical protein C0Q44_28070 [Paenibacillus sp. PCH8]|uniref:hypothetical protein n=1 Tax=Paenibacillus sp. PCH8 TaxID=2066524 RepID=UPI000CF96AD9|nr:hypothetical protein [Paenibacillus sp. PCH8]PQP80274.1 hypothetical protein C0Q44_28070 [Paenibacillus sp. PCH8]
MNINAMTDKQLNAALADLTSFEGMDEYDEPCYTYECSASLKIQSKALQVNAESYVTNLSNLMEANIFYSVEGHMAPEGIAWLLDATPLQRATAAYMTLMEASHPQDSEKEFKPVQLTKNTFDLWMVWDNQKGLMCVAEYNKASEEYEGQVEAVKNEFSSYGSEGEGRIVLARIEKQSFVSTENEPENSHHVIVWNEYERKNSPDVGISQQHMKIEERTMFKFPRQSDQDGRWVINFKYFDGIMKELHETTERILLKVKSMTAGGELDVGGENNSTTEGKDITKIMPWICINCNNKWVDSLLICWENCPECGGESQHESVRELRKDDEWYTED